MANRDRRAYFGPVYNRNFGKLVKEVDREVLQLFVGKHKLLLDSLLEESGMQSGVSKARHLFVVETVRLLDDGNKLLRPLCIWFLPRHDFVTEVNSLLTESYNLDEIKQNKLLLALNPPPDWSNWDYEKAN